MAFAQIVVYLRKIVNVDQHWQIVDSRFGVLLYLLLAILVSEEIAMFFIDVDVSG